MGRISWKERAKISDDDKQAILVPNSIRGIRTQKEQRTLEITYETGEVSCPFCLYTANIKVFLVSTKKGISTARAKCPDCKNGMLMESLTRDWTPAQYAEWCYNYRLDGFWQKVPFAKWRERLQKMHISGEFWARYKELKHENQGETVEEYYERIQREEHEQGTDT